VTRHWLAGLIFVGMLAVVPAVEAQSSTSSADLIEIDGKKNPEQIPEWLLWRESLRSVASAKANDFKLVKATLGLSEPDMGLLDKEAELQFKRDDECQKRQEVQRDELAARGEGIPAIYAQLKTVILGCRTRTLDARDRILAGLTPEGQSKVLAWVNDRRPAIRAFVAKSDLEYFKLPQ
jgi:hypothetical protein